jgi:hypothetical protein
LESYHSGNLVQIYLSIVAFVIGTPGLAQAVGTLPKAVVVLSVCESRFKANGAVVEAQDSGVFVVESTEGTHTLVLVPDIEFLGNPIRAEEARPRDAVEEAIIYLRRRVAITVAVGLELARNTTRIGLSSERNVPQLLDFAFPLEFLLTVSWEDASASMHFADMRDTPSFAHFGRKIIVEDGVRECNRHPVDGADALARGELVADGRKVERDVTIDELERIPEFAHAVDCVVWRSRPAFVRRRRNTIYDR